MRQYSLTLDQVAQAIRRWSVDLPGGAIRTEGGDIRLRTRGQAYTGTQFEQIVLLTRPDGTRVSLGDIATIRDGFTEEQSFSFFDGQRSFGVSVMSNPDENEMEISEAVHRYVEQRSKTLPPGVYLTPWRDYSVFLKTRLNMMFENLVIGAVLVFVVLSIFLHLKIGAWVIIGLPVAFFGALMMLPHVDVTINIMSLFAFIVVVGIVVDDAIIIAESVHTYTEEHGYTVDNIIRGAKRVAVPATFGVLTTIVAFLPMLFITGSISSIITDIGWVVVFCLFFSLVESKLILPSHLAIMKSSHGRKSDIADRTNRVLQHIIARIYSPLLAKAIEFRYATLAFFVALVIVMLGLIGGGTVRFVFFPEFDRDYLVASIILDDGVPDTMVTDMINKMNDDLQAVNADIKAESGSNLNIAEHFFPFIQGGDSGYVRVQLDEDQYHIANPKEIERRWREKVGDIAGAKELTFRATADFAEPAGA